MDKSHKNITYQSFNTFVFRTPCVSFQEFENTINFLNNDELFWQNLIKNKLLQEAIFLGTPILYYEIQKFLTGKLTVAKEIIKLKLSVLRYYFRMSTRCTPFGLFAGFSIGYFGGISDIELVDTDLYRRYTRLDMNYLCNLAQDICKLQDVRIHLKFYPNSSMYSLGERCRYVEYFYKNVRRVHNITAIDNSEYINVILNRSRCGARIEELAAILICEDITLEEATAFVHELIDSQILISELEPTITGKDFLIQLSSIMNTIPQIEEKNEKLAKLATLLTKIDTSKIGSTISQYGEIEHIVKELQTAYDPKFLFQTDMYKPVHKASLNKKIIQQIQEALELMNKLTISKSETLLSQFSKSYYERYEDMEMPLLQVLDTEIGIGYGAKGYASPLLAGFVFPNQSGVYEIKWNRIQSILHKKILDAYKSHTYSVTIDDKDFDFLNTNWDDLPPTLSCFCEIYSTTEEQSLIYVKNFQGSSAANLLGRFCHVNEKLENYVKEITAFEQLQNPDIIYAEIIHLPESRIGNILLRPMLRTYEIPYLGKSSVSEENQIPLSDLYVSVRGQKIFLRSKRLNKEIIPRLSCAHNYPVNAMPVYHFLCDMQTQGVRNNLNFSWGNLSNEYEFLPRVVYKNIILSLAKWTVKTESFIKLLELNEKKQSKLSSDTQLLEGVIDNIKTWREEKQLPRYVVLPDGDNDLFVDMENRLSIQTLISVIKKRTFFQLEEFLFDKEKAIVKNKLGQMYTNEFIIGLYKSENV